MATFEITIHRGRGHEGTLAYAGTIVHSAPCWWNPDKRIPAGTYAGCSKTRMAGESSTDSTGKQKRHGIFIPKVQGYQGIFLHYGRNLTKLASLRKWSQGCIVMEEADVLRIWSDIAPENGRNVTVHLIDGPATG